VSSPAAILSCGLRQIKGVAASGIAVAGRVIPRPKAQKSNEFFAVS